MAITPQATSGLASTPAARMQDIQDGVKEGTFSTEDALRLSNDPDLRALREERLAPLNRLHKILDGMLDGGPYVAPDNEMDLARGIELCLVKINAAVVRECPPERIDLLRKWWPDAQAELTKLQQPPAPQPGMGPPGAEVGMPGAPLPPGATDLNAAPPAGLDQMAAAAELGAGQMPALPGAP